MSKLNDFFGHLRMPNAAIQIGTAKRIDYVINFEDEFDFEKYVQNNQHEDIYFLAGVKPGLKVRASDDDIVSKNYFAVDFDIRKECGGCDDEQLMEAASIILRRLDDHPTYWDYSYVDFSGNGIHVWYFGNTIDANEKKEIWAAGLDFIFDDIRTSVDFPCDNSCRNISRILRIPESINNKKKKGIPGKFIFNSYRHSSLIDVVLIAGPKELERRAEKAIKQEVIYHAGKGDDTYTIINQIPISELVLKFFPDWTFDGKNFTPPGAPKPAACFVASKNRGNFVVHGGTRHFSNIHDGYSPFQFVKMMGDLSDRQTFKWFEQSYPHINEFNQKQIQNINAPRKPTTSTDSEELKPTLWRDFMKMEFSAPRWRIKNLIPAQGIVFISSPSGEKKTWVAMDMGRSIASGRQFLDSPEFEATQANVLYIDMEMSRQELQRRGKLLNFQEAQNNLWILKMDELNLSQEENVKKIETFILANEIKVIFVDTFRAVAGRMKEEKAEDVRAFFNQLLPFKDKEVCFIFLDHCRKPFQFEGKTPKKEQLFGSQDKTSNSEMLLMLKSEAGSDAVGVYPVKSRLGVEREPFGISIKDELDENLNVIGVQLTYTGSLEKEEIKKVELAKEMIVSALAEGPKKTQELVTIGQSQKIGKKNVATALKLLGVDKAVDYYKEGKQNCYFLSANQISVPAAVEIVKEDQKLNF